MSRGMFRSYQSMNVVFQTGDGHELWLGDYYAATNHSLLKQKNVRAVLTSAAMLDVHYPKDLAIAHKVINAFDIPSYKMTPHFEEAFRFIDEHLRQGNVLVHCAAGISRSTTFVLVYLMKGHGMKFQQSLEMVRAKRSVICPNYGFQNELKRYELTLQKQSQDKKEGDAEKKLVLAFVGKDDPRKTMQSEQKLAMTMGGRVTKDLLESQYKGTAFNSYNRGRSVASTRKAQLGQSAQLGPSIGGVKGVHQLLNFKLESPKIITIKR